MEAAHALNSARVSVFVRPDGECVVSAQVESCTEERNVSESTDELGIGLRALHKKFALHKKLLRRHANETINNGRFKQLRLETPVAPIPAQSTPSLFPAPGLAVSRNNVFDDDASVVEATLLEPRENYHSFKVLNVKCSDGNIDLWDVLLDQSKADVQQLHCVETCKIESQHVIRVKNAGYVVSRYKIPHWRLHNFAVSCYLDPHASRCACDRCEQYDQNRGQFEMLESRLNTIFFIGTFNGFDADVLANTLVYSARTVLQRNGAANVLTVGAMSKQQESSNLLHSFLLKKMRGPMGQLSMCCSANNQFCISPAHHVVNTRELVLDSPESWHILLEHTTPALSRSDVFANRIFNSTMLCSVLYDTHVLQHTLKHAFAGVHVQLTTLTLGQPTLKLEPSKHKHTLLPDPQIILEPRRRQCLTKLLPTLPINKP